MSAGDGGMNGTPAILSEPGHLLGAFVWPDQSYQMFMAQLLNWALDMAEDTQICLARLCVS